LVQGQPGWNPFSPRRPDTGQIATGGIQISLTRFNQNWSGSDPAAVFSQANSSALYFSTPAKACPVAVEPLQEIRAFICGL
jgi:hypothetical protein